MTSALGTIAHTTSRHCARRARSSALPPHHSAKDRITHTSLGCPSQEVPTHPPIQSGHLTPPAVHNGGGAHRLPAWRSLSPHSGSWIGRGSGQSIANDRWVRNRW